MDILGLLEITSWLVYITIAISIAIVYTVYKQSLFLRLGIPGPPTTPFLGELPKMAKKGLFQLDIDNAMTYGGCFGTYVGNIPVLMVSDPEMIQEICVKQFPNFINRAQSFAVPKRWRPAMSNATGNNWKFIRSTISPSFTSGKIKSMALLMNRCLANFKDNINSAIAVSSTLDVQKLFNSLTLDIICNCAFGIEVDSQRNPDNAFVRHANNIMNYQLQNPIIVLNYVFPELKNLIRMSGVDFIHKGSTRILLDTIEEGIAQRTLANAVAKHQQISARAKTSGISHYNDLLQHMLDSQHLEAGRINDAYTKCTDNEIMTDKTDNKCMADEEILINSIVFLLTGQSTTATALTWLAYCLATNQDCQRKLLKEIDEAIGKAKPRYESVMRLKYLDMVVSESLRLYTPASRINREALATTTVKGVKIPKGIDVTFLINGVHRNPNYWPDPEKFDPERFSPENKKNIRPFTYIPFGVGPRNCVGMRFALTIIKLSAVTLIQHVKIFPSAGIKIPPPMSKGNLLKPADGMWLTVEKR